MSMFGKKNMAFLMLQEGKKKHARKRGQHFQQPASIPATPINFGRKSPASRSQEICTVSHQYAAEALRLETPVRGSSGRQERGLPQQQEGLDGPQPKLKDEL